MKFFFGLIAFLMLSQALTAQQTYVPSDEFEQYLIDLGYDSGPLNDSVPTDNINKVIVLNTNFLCLFDFTGLEDFTALRFLSCGLNCLTTLDISKNTALDRLECDGNFLTSLDVSNNPDLIILTCDDNELTNLDVSNNPALVVLHCSHNNLISLDVSNNPVLRALHCRTNKLNCINVKNGNNKNMTGDSYFDATLNPDLYCIQVDDPAWSANNNKKWWKDEQAHYSEDCGNALYNKMTYVPDDNFEKALMDLGYDSAPLNDSVPTANLDTITLLNIEGKNISDLTGIENCPALKVLYCNNNEIASLDLNKNKALEILDCSSNYLDNIDVSNLPALKELNSSYNDILNIDVRKNTALEFIYCISNNLTALDISKNTALKGLNCDNNSLTSLDVSKNPTLETLSFNYNNLTSIDAQSNYALKELKGAFNSLTGIDITNISNLKYLDCSDNNLTGLYINYRQGIETLYCRNNKITYLDMSIHKSLRLLDCAGNNLTKLNLKNGNNKNMTGSSSSANFDARNNPDLECIQIDDLAWAENADKWYKDPQSLYSEDCGYVSVNDYNTLETDVSIFPNPANNSIIVSFKLDAPQNVMMILTDLSGKELNTFTLNNIQFINEKIDVSGYSSGIYFLNINFGGENISRKIVVE